MKDFNYLVLDRCRLGYDMTFYEMMKKHFESDNIKIVLVVDASNEILVIGLKLGRLCNMHVYDFI